MTNRNVTNHNKSLQELSPRQIAAINVLDALGTHQAAAEAAGVDRVTVSRWVSKHPEFRAEMNRRKRDRLNESQRQIVELNLMALRNLHQALEAGDVESSLRWLKLVGAESLANVTVGPTESAHVIDVKRLSLPTKDDQFYEQLQRHATTNDAERHLIDELGDAVS